MDKVTGGEKSTEESKLHYTTLLREMLDQRLFSGLHWKDQHRQIFMLPWVDGQRTKDGDEITEILKYIGERKYPGVDLKHVKRNFRNSLGSMSNIFENLTMPEDQTRGYKVYRIKEERSRSVDSNTSTAGSRRRSPIPDWSGNVLGTNDTSEVPSTTGVISTTHLNQRFSSVAANLVPTTTNQGLINTASTWASTVEKQWLVDTSKSGIQTSANPQLNLSTTLAPTFAHQQSRYPLSTVTNPADQPPPQQFANLSSTSVLTSTQPQRRDLSTANIPINRPVQIEPPSKTSREVVRTSENFRSRSPIFEKQQLDETGDKRHIDKSQSWLHRELGLETDPQPSSGPLSMAMTNALEPVLEENNFTIMLNCFYCYHQILLLEDVKQKEFLIYYGASSYRHSNCKIRLPCVEEIHAGVDDIGPDKRSLVQKILDNFKRGVSVIRENGQFFAVRHCKASIIAKVFGHTKAKVLKRGEKTYILTLDDHIGLPYTSPPLRTPDEPTEPYNPLGNCVKFRLSVGVDGSNIDDNRHYGLDIEITVIPEGAISGEIEVKKSVSNNYDKIVDSLEKITMHCNTQD